MLNSRIKRQRNFKTIVNYVGNPGLVSTLTFLLLLVVRDKSDPPSQNPVNPREPRANK